MNRFIYNKNLVQRQPLVQLTFSPRSLVHIPCCTTPNSPEPSFFCKTIASSAMICLLDDVDLRGFCLSVVIGGLLLVSASPFFFVVICNSQCNSWNSFETSDTTVNYVNVSVKRKNCNRKRLTVCQLPVSERFNLWN